MMFTKIRPLIFLALLVSLFWLPTPALADGVIIPEPPICFECPVPPPPAREVPYFTVENHRVNVTIDRQVATTRIDQVFRNDSQWSLEGTYIFPLPEEAAIGEFAMWIDGEKIEGELHTKEEARRIYDEIVRRRLDPALLEYIGRDLFQASIFPIDPGDSRRVVIEYSQILAVDNGLVEYVYPLSTEKFSAKPLEDVSISVDLASNEAIKAIYSPSHPVSIDRPNDFRALVGWEDRNVKPTTDFALYYTVSQEELGVNLLSYKDEDEDGFFSLLIAPPIEAQEIIEKDVVLILDTSGSMEGEKMAQAKGALTFVLDHLNPGDRFNVIGFSTGVRPFTNGLNGLENIPEAKSFVTDLRAEGSTDINRALLEALDSLDGDTVRPAIIIFLTDGLPTSGVTEADLILNNIDQNAGSNIRIFPFGVGDDVDTFLLDTLARQQRGTSAYVRPSQRVDESVSSFYAKVSTPVLADITLRVDGVTIEETYPYPLTDLFAGTQLIVTGRYRNGGPASVTVEGLVNGRTETFRYDDLTFRDEGGADFIPRLWATRKIGYLLNQIRLKGESREMIDQVVTLSVRYGIITPYTSFLVEEPEDALTERGRDDIVESEFMDSFSAPAEPSSGAGAVDKATESNAMENAEIAPATTSLPYGITTPDGMDSDDGTGGLGDESISGPQVTTLGDKAFILQDGIWTDTTFDHERLTTIELPFGSPAFNAFVAGHPDVTKYLALGDEVVVVVDGTAYHSILGEPTTEGAVTTNNSTPQPTATATIVNPTASPLLTPTPGDATPLATTVAAVSTGEATSESSTASTDINDTNLPDSETSIATKQPVAETTGGSLSQTIIIAGLVLVGLAIGFFWFRSRR